MSKTIIKISIEVEDDKIQKYKLVNHLSNQYEIVSVEETGQKKVSFTDKHKPSDYLSKKIK